MWVGEQDRSIGGSVFLQWSLAKVLWSRVLRNSERVVCSTGTYCRNKEGHNWGPWKGSPTLSKGLICRKPHRSKRYSLTPQLVITCRKLFWRNHFCRMTSVTHNAVKVAQNPSKLQAKNNSQENIFVMMSCQRVDVAQWSKSSPAREVPLLVPWSGCSPLPV